jgi:uncharacterized sulfatase
MHRVLFVAILLATFSNGLYADKEVVNQAPGQPNILLIFTDDHGYTDLGCQDIRKDLRTPNIDALSASGMRMTSGYVTAPQCVPSRAGLLTGKSQNRFGVESNGFALDGFDAEQTIAERLKQAGYATGMTGKWHLGDPSKIVQHGFDDVFYKNSGRPGWANFDLQGNGQKGGPEKSGLYHLDANSAAACAFIDRHRDEPFFFYCAYRAPHVPLDATPKYLKRFPGEMPERRRQALAMISAIDDGVGQMLTTLRKHGIEEKTLIYLIGDNGAPLKIHKLDAPGGGPGWDGSLNEPFNGEKGMLSEGGIRVPFLIRWKGTIPEGKQYHHPVSSLDVAATAVALAGLPSDPKLDGVNVIPYLKDETKGPPHESLFWRWIAQSATRQGKWKYLLGGEREYLFDLETDKEETKNLIQQFPEVASRLRANLESWATPMNPPGLATGKMSVVWENYFDFYLDGKEPPPLRAKFQPDKNVAAPAGVMDRWIGRNAVMQVKDGWLEVTPKNGKAKPFLVVSELKLPQRVQASVSFRSLNPDEIGFQWRESGQKGFFDSQVVKADCEGSPETQTVRLDLEGTNEIIHVRLMVPTQGAAIDSVEFQNANGKVLEKWDF